jgi:hypothetical protein
MDAIDVRWLTASFISHPRPLAVSRLSISPDYPSDLHRKKAPGSRSTHSRSTILADFA